MIVTTSFSPQSYWIKNKLEEYNQKYWLNKFNIIIRDDSFFENACIGSKFFKNNEWYGIYFNVDTISDLTDNELILLLKKSHKIFYREFNREILGLKKLEHKIKKLGRRR